MLSPDADSLSPDIDPPVEDQPDEDFILISKSFLIAAIAVILAFFIGNVSGYFLFYHAYNQGADDTIADIQLAAAAQQALPRPTVAPARLDNVSVDDDPSIGPADAPITIVEFSDFECPWCAHFHQNTLYEVLEKYGDQVRVVYRDYPMNMHPNAPKAAQAAECADEQGQFWALHDAMFESLTVTGVGLPAITGMASSLDLDMDAFQECVDSGKYADEIAKDMEDGVSYGVSATPTFFINGVRLVGAASVTQFSEIIDEELENR